MFPALTVLLAGGGRPGLPGVLAENDGVILFLPGIVVPVL